MQLNVPWVVFEGLSILLSWVGYIVAERRWRARWHSSVMATQATESPYRAAAWRRETGGRAPSIIRRAAWSGILLGSVAVPGVAYAMATLHFDGIALSLVPGLASVAAAWCAGWLLLARAPAAVDMGKLTARASATANALGSALALLHVLAARVGWSDRESLGYVVVACVLAVVAIPQSMILRAAVERHANALRSADRLEACSQPPTVAVEMNEPVHHRAVAARDDRAQPFAGEWVDHEGHARRT